MKRIIFLLTAIFVSTFAYAQTETTNWYIDTEVYQTTTCESGGDITVPTEPTKYGYTFQGWIPAVYDMSTLDKSINGTSSTNSGKNWRVIFPYGAVYGVSLCSPTPQPGTSWYTIDDPVDTETGSGRYCWCRVTEFIPTGSRIIYEPKSSLWAFARDFGSASACASNCSYYCGHDVRNYVALRAGLFGSVAPDAN